ncbi:MAG TPA: hypothetical protein VF749_06380 [Candidatus Acidoferrum sp.]
MLTECDQRKSHRHLRVAVPYLFPMDEKPLHHVLEGAHLQLGNLLVEGCLVASLNELSRVAFAIARVVGPEAGGVPPKGPVSRRKTVASVRFMDFLLADEVRMFRDPARLRRENVRRPLSPLTVRKYNSGSSSQSNLLFNGEEEERLQSPSFYVTAAMIVTSVPL